MDRDAAITYVLAVLTAMRDSVGSSSVAAVAALSLPPRWRAVRVSSRSLSWNVPDDFGKPAVGIGESEEAEGA